MPNIYSVNEGNREKQSRVVTVDLSPRLIFLIVLGLCIVFFGNQLLTILMFLMLGFIFMSTSLPLVHWFMKKGCSRAWSVFITYTILVLVLSSIFSAVVIPFVGQLDDLVAIIPTWISEGLSKLKDVSIAGYSLELSSVETYITDLIKSLPTFDNFKNITSVLTNFFSSFSIVVTAVIFSIYLILEHDSLLDIVLIRITSDQKRERVKKLVIDVESKLGSWVLGQGIVSLLATLYTAIILTILKIQFAIPLAVFVGLMGLIPNIGATLAGFAISLVTLIVGGPVKAIVVLALFLFYQPIENSIISPKVMGNAVGLKPVIVMLGVIAMIILIGPFGGLIAVPLIVVLKIIYEFYIDLQKIKAKGIV